MGRVVEERALAQLTTLGMMAGLLLTGALSGVYLGKSAVNEINPAHFRGPALHPRDRGAEVDPNVYVERSAFAGAVWYGDKPRLEGPACADCELYRLAIRSAGVEAERYVEEIRTGSLADPVEVRRDFAEALGTAVDRAHEAHREALAQVARYAQASNEPPKVERTPNVERTGPSEPSLTAIAATGFTE
jgi:hypothetical protein